METLKYEGNIIYSHRSVYFYTVLQELVLELFPALKGCTCVGYGDSEMANHSPTNLLNLQTTNLWKIRKYLSCHWHNTTHWEQLPLKAPSDQILVEFWHLRYRTELSCAFPGLVMSRQRREGIPLSSERDGHLLSFLAESLSPDIMFSLKNWKIIAFYAGLVRFFGQISNVLFLPTNPKWTFHFNGLLL